MKKHLLTVLALLVLPLIGWAGSGGTYTTGTGDVTVTTDLSPSHNTLTVTLSTTLDDGTTVTRGPVVVNANPNGDGHDILSSPELALDGEIFQWRNGFFCEKQDDGTWKKRPKKKTGGKRGSSMSRLVAGELAPTDGVLWLPTGPELPMLQGEVAPWDGYWSSPGDEIVSLPTGPVTP